MEEIDREEEEKKLREEEKKKLFEQERIQRKYQLNAWKVSYPCPLISVFSPYISLMD